MANNNRIQNVDSKYSERFETTIRLEYVSFLTSESDLVQFRPGM